MICAFFFSHIRFQNINLPKAGAKQKNGAVKIDAFGSQCFVNRATRILIFFYSRKSD